MDLCGDGLHNQIRRNRLLEPRTAAELARFFVHSIVLRHGAPTVGITDRGTAFLAELKRCLLNMTRTVHRQTTAYPQRNGLNERLNRTLADMISICMSMLSIRGTSRLRVACAASPSATKTFATASGLRCSASIRKRALRRSFARAQLMVLYRP